MLKIYINDPSAPKPNRPITPGACAVIVDGQKNILLHKREDMKDLWSLPGGKMNPGESIADCCIREIKEEMGLEVRPTRLVGLFTSPGCIFEWSPELVYQSFVTAFLCDIVSGEVTLNKESDDYGWFSPDEIRKMETVPYVKEIVDRALSNDESAFFD